MNEEKPNTRLRMSVDPLDSPATLAGALQFAPLIGLFGPNNSGKTSILQVLQIILESYSEHLLLHLMHRIAEEQILADDTVRYFCQINNSTSKIERLKVSLTIVRVNWWGRREPKCKGGKW